MGLSFIILKMQVFFSVKKRKYSFTGKIVGANFKMGHLLKSLPLENKDEVTKITAKIIKIDTLIIGGGISGLSAGHWLNKNEYKDFLILEMDDQMGGNSAFGQNGISGYPWGAHYVPIPSNHANYTKIFFEDIGVITGYDEQSKKPIYNEYYLCSDPQEKVFFEGRWQEGIFPQKGIPREDLLQYEAFFTFIENMKNTKGSDGKDLFTIPMELSSQDPSILELDTISMESWLNARGWNSVYLHRYINYCCRDDYGMNYQKISAWAGIHYFAARVGVGANTTSSSILTWPNGNGFLVEKLEQICLSKIHKNNLVYFIKNVEHGAIVKSLNTKNMSTSTYQAKNVIFCGPRFIAHKIIHNLPNVAVNSVNTPWLVANISVTQINQFIEEDLAWDNVNFYSKSLGIIVANHQDLTFNHQEKVFTYYLPLDDNSPHQERIEAYRRTYEDWLDIVIPDLELIFPGISRFITHLDIWIWGHGMCNPGINYLWSKERKQLLESFKNIHFAHSEMSGISIFEEAQYRGVQAAIKVLEGKKDV